MTTKRRVSGAAFKAINCRAGSRLPSFVGKLLPCPIIAALMFPGEPTSSPLSPTNVGVCFIFNETSGCWGRLFGAANGLGHLT